MNRGSSLRETTGSLVVLNPNFEAGRWERTESAETSKGQAGRCVHRAYLELN